MSTATTTSTADGTTDPFDHPALCYQDTAEYLAGTVPFIRDGLAHGEPVAVAVPGPNLALLRDALGAEARSVRMVDMTEAGRNPGRIIPGVLRAFADAHLARRVRIVGEPVWAGRSPTEYPACVQHEALINLAFSGRHATILCPYDVTRLGPAMLADARATHPVLIDTKGRHNSADFDPEAVLKACNVPLSAPPPASTSVAFDVDTLHEIRHFTAARAHGAGLSQDRVDDVELAVCELTTNSVVHGGGRGTLTMWTEDGRFVCQVQDTGELTDPLAGRIPARGDDSGGRGLLLVNHLTDLVRVHTSTSGTTIRVYVGG